MFGNYKKLTLREPALPLGTQFQMQINKLLYQFGTKQECTPKINDQLYSIMVVGHITFPTKLMGRSEVKYHQPNTFGYLSSIKKNAGLDVTAWGVF